MVRGDRSLRIRSLAELDRSSNEFENDQRYTGVGYGELMTIIGRLLVYQANGRPPGVCHAGLYIVVQGIAAAVGRLLEKPYQRMASSRAIRWAPRA
jgi:hypothetical protein